MNPFEYRAAKGGAFCRLCTGAITKRAIFLPAKLAGKHVQIILCAACVSYLKAHIDAQEGRSE